MPRQVRVQMPSGQVIWATVADDSPRNVSDTSMIKRLDLEDLKGAIRGVSESMRLALQDLAPDDVAVEFGVELAIKSGKLTSVLAEASGKASVKVTVGWRNVAGAATADENTEDSEDSEAQQPAEQGTSGE